MTVPLNNSFDGVLAKAINDRVEQIINEETQNIKLLVEKRVRGEIGSIAANVCKNISYQTRQESLIIEVKFKDLG